jgi:hypothetical protein
MHKIWSCFHCIFSNKVILIPLTSLINTALKHPFPLKMGARKHNFKTRLIELTRIRMRFVLSDVAAALVSARRFDSLSFSKSSDIIGIEKWGNPEIFINSEVLNLGNRRIDYFHFEIAFILYNLLSEKSHLLMF